MMRCGYTLLLVMMFFANSYAGVDYQMSLEDGKVVDSNTFEFNVYIKSMDTTFQLTSYQCSFLFNLNKALNSTLNFTYIPKTSELSNPPAVGIGVKQDDGIQKLAFASMPGSDYISSTPLRVGSFRLQSTDTIGSVNANLKWSFDGKIVTILTGTAFVDITNPSNHIKSFGDLVIYQVAGVTASAIADSNYGPEKTVDGLGYYDGDKTSRWTAQPMPQYLIFDLGSEKSVSMTKFSFFNFQKGRIYQYTTSVSDDQVNWKDIVVNASSASEEWTVDQFAAVQARYIKLEFLSSTNNPDNWANLWEAQILGTDKPSTSEDDLVSNGTFDADTNWSKGTGCSIGGGVASIDGSQTGNTWFTQTCLPSPSYNKTYLLTFDLTVSAGFAFFDLGGYDFPAWGLTSSGSYSYYFTVTNTLSGSDIHFGGNADFIGSFDNVVVKEQFNNRDSVTENKDVEQNYKYLLQQNYPNPFNPSTTIEFGLKEDSKVKLTVYNILGEEVAELVNGEMNAGVHKVNFNGANLASGIYIYRLDAGNKFTETKKMVLIK